MNLQRLVLVTVATSLVATVTARSAFDALTGSEHRSNANGDTWAVLVAGSMGWGNYRHQADVAHAYQVLRKGGVKKNRIITLMYNDVVNNAANPHSGKLYNRPGGDDVYDGVVVDYEGEHVTAATFMAVLAGNKSEVANTTGSSGRVLESKAEDHVFVYFSDHGAPGIISMPVGPFVYADQLLKTLRTRHAANGFGSMVLYIEACESGSMFEDLLEEDLNIWAVTASNGQESSWGTYCPGQDPSPPPEFTTCLADLFSAAWMEDAESADACQETLQKQFDNVRLRTSQNNTYAQGSHVQHFGTLQMSENHTSVFLGSGTCKYRPEEENRGARSNPPGRRRDRVPQRDADLVHLRVAHERAAPGPAKIRAQRALARELAARAAVDDAVWAASADLAEAAEVAEVARDPRRGGMHLGRASWDELARAPLWRRAADWAGRRAGRLAEGAPGAARDRADSRREAARRLVNERVAPPSGRSRLVDDWECLRGMVAAWEDACGPLGQYGMRHSRAFANMCNAGRAPEHLRARAEAVCTVPVRAVLRGEGLVPGAEE